MRNKENLKRTLSIILLFSLIIIAINPCNVSAATKVTPKLSKTSLSIQQGTNYSLQLYNVSSSSVKWSSSNKKIVTVTSKGKVKAVSPGTATISAKYKSKTYKCKVTVKKFDLKYVDIEESSILYDQYKLVKYTNNNDYNIELIIKNGNYDEDGFYHGTDYEYLLIKKGESVYASYSKFDKQILEMNRVDSSCFKIDQQKLQCSYEINNEAKFSYEKMICNITNQNSSDLYGRLFVIFYDKDGNVVDVYHQKRLTISLGETLNIYAYLRTDVIESIDHAVFFVTDISA